MSVVIETTIGDITVDLYLKERPNACLNFLKLCKVKYYNLCLFHKVERNFIAQTGDPTSTGRGGESIFSRVYGDQAAYFEAELKPRLKHEKLGTLSMVNNGNNMNGSQFFLTLSENLTYLDEIHTVFGEVAEGFDILQKINEAICDPNNRPYQDIRITHTVVLYDPYDDPSGLEIPDASPLPTKEQLESNYIAADEEIDDNEGKNAEEIEEKIKESEAKARATILEMVGDIPDADVRPPENVLFVCKLNPVTTSEDLEIIFSRFGPIVSCEVIKDKKTDESLQYAFIEFEKEEDCENAYFKMDNVLIDDRRIHVDFSQSVSKMMHNKGNTFSKEKNNRKEKFAIKDKPKSDKYDLIFDMDNDSSHSKRKKKNDHKSPDRKHKRYEARDSEEYSSRKSEKYYDSKYIKSRRHDKSKSDASNISRSPLSVSHKKSHASVSRNRHDSSAESDSEHDFSSKKHNHKRSHHHRSSSSHSVSPPSFEQSRHKNKHSSKSKNCSPAFEKRITEKSRKDKEKKYYSGNHFVREKSKSPKRITKQASSPEYSYREKYKRSRSPHMHRKKHSHNRRSRTPELTHQRTIKSREIYRSRSRSPLRQTKEKHRSFKRQSSFYESDD
ncbi:peptidyl-prolyl cis-trans isomerase-like 4 [Caerostris darwini]|uniref:Peptidyl-prolyl cis-trans isomerase n=1 Tax=Caerostris darwini TaxID=1538125 RepID=A0AAV4N3Z2_9ARAC|nr:peptidyl-prolyl cis-trans isomerase-like 4 [Caerostris darwini]